MMPVDRPHAIIIGGSLGGLLAASLLRTLDWRVSVFERSSADLASRGAGLGTRPELLQVLRRIGIEFDHSVGVDVRSRIWLRQDGSIGAEYPLRSYATAWDRIYGLLKRAIPSCDIHRGTQFERLTQENGHVIAHFADGSCATGDLLIGADGMHSTVRRQFLPEVGPQYAGYVHWRGVVAENVLPPALRPLLLHHMAFAFPDQELAFSVPMPEGATSDGMARCQFGWFRPADATTVLPDLATDEFGRSHGASIPPPLIRRSVLKQMKEEAEKALPPQLSALIQRAPQPVLQPIFDLEAPRLTFGRTILLGDAAFVARPHVGTGVTKAALDAQALVDCIAASGGKIDAALNRYERERRRFGRALVKRGRYLGRYVGTAEPGDKPGPDRDPRLGIREIGAAGLIVKQNDASWP